MLLFTRLESCYTKLCKTLFYHLNSPITSGSKLSLALELRIIFPKCKDDQDAAKLRIPTLQAAPLSCCIQEKMWNFVRRHRGCHSRSEMTSGSLYWMRVVQNDSHWALLEPQIRNSVKLHEQTALLSQRILHRIRGLLDLSRTCHTDREYFT